MDEDKCPKCGGSGKATVVQRPDGYRAPINLSKIPDCKDCDGTGLRKR